MGLSLIKGQNAALDSGLTEVMVGLGWDPRQGAGEQFDLDASAFLLNASKKVRSDRDFIFFNQKTSTCGSVQHQGDNLTGEGEGDDEQIKVNLKTLPADVDRIVFTVTIYKAGERKQNFGQVDDAFIRIVDCSTNEEIMRFDLTEDACVNQALVFGEIYRHNGAWKFRALAQGYDYEIGALARMYGVNV